MADLVMPRTVADADARGWKRATLQEVAAYRARGGGVVFEVEDGGDRPSYCYVSPRHNGERVVCWRDADNKCSICFVTREGC